MIWSLVAVAVLFAWVHMSALAEPASVDSGPNFAVSLLMLLILATIASFATLTVSIDKTYLRLKFGWGVFHKKFALADIASAKAVRNSWYHGLGIHYIWPGNVWVYNVSGFDAVELVMKNGKRVRIGTDEPQKLEQAITSTFG